ncbi:MAG: isopenicillin N synthase family dioxygenase [Acidimicrobiales bacterium]
MIPIVDLRTAGAVSLFDQAMRNLGFVQLVGHGLNEDVATGFRELADRFFALSTPQKQGFVHADPIANRGFNSKGSEALSYSLGEPSPPDLFESFNCGRDGRVGGSPLLQPTPWPDELVPGFAAAAHAYIGEMERISVSLDRMIGGLIGVDDLADRSDRGPDTLAAIDYRPGPDGAEPLIEGQQRMGAHSDYTTFTILLADPVPGLQIVTAEGWVDVIPDPGALLVNVGDVLAIYTNDRWPSTLHRVVPMNAGAAPTRRSAAYFHYPNLDVEVAPLPRFVSSDRPARYGAVTVADHLTGKLTSPKLQQNPTSADTSAGRTI